MRSIVKKMPQKDSFTTVKERHLKSIGKWQNARYNL